jgi:hypothetical protein
MEFRGLSGLTLRAGFLTIGAKQEEGWSGR